MVTPIIELITQEDVLTTEQHLVENPSMELVAHPPKKELIVVHLVTLQAKEVVEDQGMVVALVLVEEATENKPSKIFIEHDSVQSKATLYFVRYHFIKQKTIVYTSLLINKTHKYNT